MLAMMVMPKGLYGISCSSLSKRQLGMLRGSVMAALWGKKRGRRCLEVVSALFCKGHLVDSWQVVVHQRL
eukprot:3908755-Karenia_brevis.AAC.1